MNKILICLWNVERYDFAQAKKKSKNGKFNPKFLQVEWHHTPDQGGASYIKLAADGQEPLKFSHHLFPHKTTKAPLWETTGVFLEQAQNKAFQYKIDDFRH